MKRQIDYHEITVSFVVSHRDAKRATGHSNRAKSSDVRAKLAEMLTSAIISNDTNALDAEDIRVTIDGKEVDV